MAQHYDPRSTSTPDREEEDAAAESTPLLPKKCEGSGVIESGERAELFHNDVPQSSFISRSVLDVTATKAGYKWCTAFSTLLLIIFLVILMYTRRMVASHRYVDDLSIFGSPKQSKNNGTNHRHIPHPPQPYEYFSFLKWLDGESFGGHELQLIPKRSWFDAEKAIEQKSNWFQQEDMTAVLKAFRMVHRWSFMLSIMRTGHEEIQAAVIPHLRTMRWLQESLTKAETVLDMGCGTGALLRYLQVLAQQLGNDKLRAVGFDMAAPVVSLARSLLRAEDKRAPGLPKPYLFNANMYNQDEVLQALNNPLPLKPSPDPNSTDAMPFQPVDRIDLVIVSAAIGAEIAPVSNETRNDRALRVAAQGPLAAVWPKMQEGLAVVPICKEKAARDLSCKADFFLIGKNSSGQLEVLQGGDGDTAFEIKYRVALNKEVSGSFGELVRSESLKYTS